MIKMPSKNLQRVKNKKQRNQRGEFSEKQQLYKQLYEADLLVIDTVYTMVDSASTGWDLYTQIAGSTDYTNALVAYGEMSWQSVEFNVVPHYHTTTLLTDFAQGAFAIRQGVFDITVTAKNFINVLREPGSFEISNKLPWFFRSPIVMKNYISTTDTNTAQSQVPKINSYCGYNVLTTTNSNQNQIHCKVLILFRAKID